MTRTITLCKEVISGYPKTSREYKMAVTAINDRDVMNADFKLLLMAFREMNETHRLLAKEQTEVDYLKKQLGVE